MENAGIKLKEIAVLFYISEITAFNILHEHPGMVKVSA